MITLAGSLDDVTDDGQPVQCIPGTAIYHAGNTVHQATGKFWVGIYHQPTGRPRRRSLSRRREVPIGAREISGGSLQREMASEKFQAAVFRAKWRLRQLRPQFAARNGAREISGRSLRRKKAPDFSQAAVLRAKIAPEKSQAGVSQ